MASPTPTCRSWSSAPEAGPAPNVLDSRHEAVVAAWLERLTLRQKLGQMTMAERNSVTPEDVKRHALGAVLSGGGSHPEGNAPEDWVRMNDAFWQAAVGDEAGRDHAGVGGTRGDPRLALLPRDRGGRHDSHGVLQ